MERVQKPGGEIKILQSNESNNMRFIKINQLTTNKDIIKYTYFVLVYVDDDKLINFHHMPV